MRWLERYLRIEERELEAGGLKLRTWATSSTPERPNSPLSTPDFRAFGAARPAICGAGRPCTAICGQRLAALTGGSDRG
jgi:hypothetical protein